MEVKVTVPKNEGGDLQAVMKQLEAAVSRIDLLEGQVSALKIQLEAIGA